MYVYFLRNEITLVNNNQPVITGTPVSATDVWKCILFSLRHISVHNVSPGITGLTNLT
jgi:hypothetical protein